MRVRLLPPILPLLALAAAGCGTPDDGHPPGEERVLVVFNAGSLARPLRVALDSFAQREGITLEQESAGSLETARKMTELRRAPDIIALADEEIFPRLLMPDHVSWYARFARNRLVLAYTDGSLHASELTASSWITILERENVQVGRSDPNLDPAGYRTLMLFQLAERHLREPGLAARLLATAPQRHVRPKEVELTGLLQAGELDYIWTYESVAQAAGLQYLTLQGIDLGTPADSASYARVAVRVAGRAPGDTLELRGKPIAYALSVPAAAPHPRLAARAAEFLLSADGARLMRSAQLDVLESPEIVGSPPRTAEAMRSQGGNPRVDSASPMADSLR